MKNIKKLFRIFKYHHFITNFFISYSSSNECARAETYLKKIFCQILQLLLDIYWKENIYILIEPTSLCQNIILILISLEKLLRNLIKRFKGFIFTQISECSQIY